MAAYPVLADMQSVMEAIAALTAQVVVITTLLQNVATAARNNATITTTASTYAMAKDHLKV